MSGRKSTEVNGLLARGKNARNAGKANYENKFHQAEKLLKENQTEIERIYKKISESSFCVNTECKAEFPEESKQLEAQYNDICRKNHIVSYVGELKNFAEADKKLQKELADADKEGDRIREKIRNKSWYCDQEYREADRLVSVYKKIADNKNQLVADINKKMQESSQNLIQYKNLEKKMSQLEQSQKNLQQRAKEICELRAKAEQAKSYVNRIYQSIDSVLAEKFLPDTYHEISEETGQFLKLSDTHAVKQVTNITEKISLFVNNLQKKHMEFLERKEKAEAALEDNMYLISTEKNFYFEPIDYFKNKEKAVQISLLDYLKEYSDKEEMVFNIQDGIETVKNLILEENFEAAQAQAADNTKLIEQAAGYAVILQEHLIENFYVAKDIKNVMVKMGFETGAVKLDGNLKNGWKITAKSPGGENIDFSQVFINDDGEVKIDINHKTMGSCSSKWEDICNALEETGIYIEKIDMKNGGNVLNKREHKKASEDTVKNERQYQV